jgi:hypothetical protein
MSKFLGRLMLLVVILALLFALYTWITLTFVYADGSRAGFLQKFSKSGWICKTWEGELVTGAMLGNQEIFSFSVRDEELAKILRHINNRFDTNFDITFFSDNGVIKLHRLFDFTPYTPLYFINWHNLFL